MKDFFAKIKGIGDTYYKTIYGFYNEPLMFTCETCTGSCYVFLRLADEVPTWLAAEISSSRLRLLESNQIEMRKIFTEPENTFVSKVYGTGELLEQEVLLPKDLSEDMLPYSGEYLDYESEEFIEREDVSIIAKEENRTVIEMSLEKDDGHTREIDLSVLSETLNCVQMLIYSLACKENKLYGSFPRKIKEQYQLSVTDTFAASFGIQMKMPQMNSVDDSIEADAVLGELNAILSNGEEGAIIHNKLVAKNTRAVINYKKLLQNLQHNRVGIQITSASPTFESRNAHLSTKDVTDKLTKIKRELKKSKKSEEYSGTLVGIDLVKKRFTFLVDNDSNQMLQGNIDNGLQGHEYMVPKQVGIKVETTISFDSITGKEKTNIKLLDVN